MHRDGWTGPTSNRIEVDAGMKKKKKKKKRTASHWHEGQQVPTKPTTVEKIMAARAFTLGVVDARARLPFRRDYDRWETNAQWDYERGRAWAILAPREIPLQRNGKIGPEALKWAKRLMSLNGDIL
jgi:hypothetical protein